MGDAEMKKEITIMLALVLCLLSGPALASQYGPITTSSYQAIFFRLSGNDTTIPCLTIRPTGASCYIYSYGNFINVEQGGVRYTGVVLREPTTLAEFSGSISAETRLYFDQTITYPKFNDRRDFTTAVS